MASPTIYHVTRQWDGQTLLSLSRQGGWSDAMAERIAQRWPDCDPWTYYETEGDYIHCHATLAEAVDYRDEWCEGGVILAIDATGIEVQEGREYPHPVVRREIPAWLISLIEVE